MNSKTIILSRIILACFAIVAFSYCKNKPKEETPVLEGSEVSITPVNLPSIVPGFKFPEDSTTIYGWMTDSSFKDNYDSVSIYKHAWGIWAGLTAPTDQTYADDKMLVYETWMGLNVVRNFVEGDKSACNNAPFTRVGRATLSRPKQFEHAARFGNFDVSKAVGANSESNLTEWVTVSYSPDASCYSTDNQIFKQSVINKYYTKDAINDIPQFPNSAITIKPTYLVYKDTKSKLLKMPVWLDAPNPPGAVQVNDFPYSVYIDVDNKQPANKKLVPAPSGSTDKKVIEAATCNLKDFIYIKIDAKMASMMNEQDSVQGMNNSGQGYGTAKAGQIAILVAMHVTTKEIANWTWQTYYWTPNPDNPGSPSSVLAGKTRPKELVGAASHYAAVASYAMLMPYGAKNTTPGAAALFGYNPYLEGGFGPSTFGLANTFNPNFKYGMETNCMSCHGLAIPSPSGQYTTDQYIDMSDPTLFKSQVKLDFAWSIQQALINDTIPYWEFK